MSITFGAVGDIISVCLVVKDLVDALDEARGSKAEYQAVVRELWILDRALLEIDLLARAHGNGVTPEIRGLCETAQRAATRCKTTISDFLDRIKKYKTTFEDGHNPGVLRKAALGVRWRIGEREAVERFRVEIAATSASLQMLLAAANMNLLALNKRDVQDHFSQLEQRDKQRIAGQQALLLDLRDRISNATQHIISGNVLLNKITDALRLDWVRQLGSDLKSLMQRVVATNIATYHAIVSIQTTLSSRLERTLVEEPFLLEDPIGRVSPVHLQFVTSWDAFNAVLEIRFRNLQGFRKIKDKQYGLQEKGTQRNIDQSRPWESAFLPGQRIEMSFVFCESGRTNESPDTATCPGCQTPTCRPLDIEVQCNACLMWFRRITVVAEVDPSPLPNPWRWRSTFGQVIPHRRLSGPIQPGKRKIPSSDHEDEDDLRDFKRIRLVSEKKVMRRGPFARTEQASLYAFIHRPIVFAPSNTTVLRSGEPNAPS